MKLAEQALEGDADLKFTILKNESYVDQLSLDEFIKQSTFELKEEMVARHIMILRYISLDEAKSYSLAPFSCRSNGYTSYFKFGVN